MARYVTGAVAATIVVLALAATAAASRRPPSAAAIDRATERFLAEQPPPHPAPRPRAPGVTGELFPASRVVSFYGAPQMGQTVLGMYSPPAAAKRLAAQSAPYASLGARPVIGEFDLVSVFATAGGGSDGLYRQRQSPEVTEIYLAQARTSGSA